MSKYCLLLISTIPLFTHGATPPRERASSPQQSIPTDTECPPGWIKSLYQNFNHRPANYKYTQDALRANFPYLGFSDPGPSPNNTLPTIALRGPGDGALVEHYPVNCVRSLFCGYQWLAGLPAVDESWFSYSLRFENGFAFARGGKLPGICGGRCNSGGLWPNGKDGWSARGMWRESDGQATQYLYFIGMPTSYGLDVNYTSKAGEKVRFQPGVWHSIRMRVKLNDPGKKNGELETWFDNQPVIYVGNLNWRTANTLHIDQFYMSNFFGGSDETWASPKTQTIMMDNIMVCRRQNAQVFAQPRAFSGPIALMCPEGQKAKRGKCADFDECKKGVAKCTHRCTNTNGSFTCSCPRGLSLGSDGRTCSQAS